MPSVSQKTGKYIPLRTTDESLSSEPEKDVEASSDSSFHDTRWKARWVSTAIASCITVAILLAISILGYLQTHNHASTSTASSPCQNPTMLQEWRSLSEDQQHYYINAALCLRNTPSKLHNDMALYEDFPFLHDVVGDYAHETAGFLTWHRYFIHLYESSLRDECGYKGSCFWIRYWDWSLDWKDLTRSPVFQNSPGFGGDSHFNSTPSAKAIVGGDRCVDDGPWAGMTVHWWTQSTPPHCLSRGFQDVTPMNDMGR
ncbi:hypothetical protein BKA64DRAFT_713295 [Cadophora sp. MPI-SDFR-AT-0126]|nr:hypothetical protein BKA64DRAFT_713295 [Leotiomycetes sp. MPI-SDFR-AT-0126]